MKNGFTLLELIMAITILAIVLLIAGPLVLDMLTSTKKKMYDGEEKMLITCAKSYASENIEVLPSTVGQTKTIPIVTLINDGCMNPIIDYDTKNECSGHVTVKKTGVNVGNIEYSVYLECDTYTTQGG